MRIYKTSSRNTHRTLKGWESWLHTKSSYTSTNPRGKSLEKITYTLSKKSKNQEKNQKNQENHKNQEKKQKNQKNRNEINLNKIKKVNRKMFFSWFFWFFWFFSWFLDFLDKVYVIFSSDLPLGRISKTSKWESPIIPIPSTRPHPTAGHLTIWSKKTLLRSIHKTNQLPGFPTESSRLKTMEASCNAGRQEHQGASSYSRRLDCGLKHQRRSQYDNIASNDSHRWQQTHVKPGH